MDDDGWVTAAMADSSLVVAVLVRLHGSGPPSSSPAPRSAKTTRTTAPLEWRVRQQRSKPLSVVLGNRKKQAQRASPKTPLTWSGSNTSHSGGCSGGSGGYGESSRPLPPAAKPSSAARSKISLESDKTNSRRPKRKKTLLELRDEESSLIQERKELKRRLSKLHIHLEKQRSINHKLKKMKKKEELRRKSSKSALVPDLNIPFEEDLSLSSSILLSAKLTA